MKKSLLLAAAAFLGLAPGASAVEQVTRQNCAEKIVDGAIIALQCKDTNGGCNYFFNGDARKTATVTYSQLWRVVNSTTEGQIYLQRVSDGKYVTGCTEAGASIALTDDKSAATSLRAFGVSAQGWGNSKPTPFDPNTAETIRFANGDLFLNTNAKGSVPYWWAGKAGYSVWCVYKFTDQEVAAMEAISQATQQNPYPWTPTPLAELEDHTILRSMVPTTEVSHDDDGYYLIYSVGQQKYLKQEGHTLKFVDLNAASEDFTNAGSAVDNAGYIFKLDPAKFSDFGTQYTNIISGYGSYVSLVGNDAQLENGPGSVISFFPRSFSIENIEEEGQPTETFLIGDKVINKYVNATAQAKITAYGTVGSTDNNNLFRFYPIDMVQDGEKVVTFNVTLTYNGAVVRTRTISAVANTEFHGETPDFFTDEIIITTPENDGETVYFELKNPVVPFKYTETTENMIWQAIQHHPSYATSNYIWCYNPDAATATTHKMPEDAEVVGFRDEELWAFVGDFGNGFKIYNRAAGMDKCLVQEGDNIVIGTVDEANPEKALWKPYVSKDKATYAPTVYCTFKNLAGSSYINMQNVTQEYPILTFYSEADQGSTAWFHSPAEYLLNHYLLVTYDSKPIVGHDGIDHVVKYVPEEAVGARDFPEDTEFLNDGPAINDAAAADPYNMEKVKALANFLTEYETKVPLRKFDVNSWYRILSPCHGKYIRTSNTDMSMNNIDMDSHRKDYHTVFKFDQVEGTADSPLYTIYSQGLYFGQVTYDTPVYMVEDPAQAGQFGPFDADGEPAIYGLGDFHADGVGANTEDKVYIHLPAGANAQVKGWGKYAAGSHFILMPANDIEFDLDHAIDDKHVGFGFFPFAVSAATEGTTLHFVHEEDGKLTTSETTVVPAHTAFVACSATSTTVDLNIVTETAPAAMVQSREGKAAAAHVMTGTLRPAQTDENDYVLDDLSENKFGFKKVTSATAVAGNSVYLPATNLSAKALENAELPLSDPTTTSISELRAEKASTVYYDLSGRRVSNPKSGIYVTGNGKKIVL